MLNEPLYTRPVRTVVWEAHLIAYKRWGRLLDYLRLYILHFVIINFIIFPLAFILKLIITENMKAVVHNWIEKDLKKNN